MTTIQARMKNVAAKHGIHLTTAANCRGSVFTTPDHEAWPLAMRREMMTIADLRRGPEGDYWRDVDAEGRGA